MIIEITSCEFDYPTLGVRYKKERNCIHTYSPSPYLFLFFTFSCSLYTYLLVVIQLIIFTTSLPAIGSVAAFSVHMVEIIASPFPSAIYNIVKPRMDSIRSMRSSGLPPSM